jgi:hypothetical protein
MCSRGPKATDGYNSFWRDHYHAVQSSIAQELGNIPKRMVRQRDVTMRLKKMWSDLAPEEKVDYKERDQR